MIGNITATTPSINFKREDPRMKDQNFPTIQVKQEVILENIFPSRVISPVKIMDASSKVLTQPKDLKPGMINETIKWITSGVAGGGIAACDESLGSIGKLLDSIGLKNTEENRRLYRDILISSPHISESGVTGMILFTESMKHKTSNGVLFGEQLKKSGVIPIVKPDLGLVPIGDKGEQVTQGLQHPDGKGGLMQLKKELTDMAALGALAAKWRAAIQIDEKKGLPTDRCIDANATNLALYALACHEAGLAPMVEPEILIEGSHSIEKAAEVSGKVINALFQKLKLYGVDLSKVILKTGFVVPGKNNPAFKTVSPEEVAKATVKCFKENVPAMVPGVNFLSGGIADEKSFEYLNAVAQEAKKQNVPWNLSFSFGRAIQFKALQEFGKQMKEAPTNPDIEKIQSTFEGSANNCRKATLGKL